MPITPGSSWEPGTAGGFSGFPSLSNKNVKSWTKSADSRNEVPSLLRITACVPDRSSSPFRISWKVAPASSITSAPNMPCNWCAFANRWSWKKTVRNSSSAKKRSTKVSYFLAPAILFQPFAAPSEVIVSNFTRCTWWPTISVLVLSWNAFASRNSGSRFVVRSSMQSPALARITNGSTWIFCSSTKRI